MLGVLKIKVYQVIFWLFKMKACACAFLSSKHRCGLYALTHMIKISKMVAELLTDWINKC